MDKEYFKNVDLLRFILALFIVLLHICCMFSEYSLFLQKFHSNNMNCVQLFFIISGFMLILTFNSNTTVLKFFLKKVARLLPVIAFATLVCFFLSLFKVLHFAFMDNIFALFFLNGMQIASNHIEINGWGSVFPSWYVSVLVWVSLLYFYIIKNFGYKVLNVSLWFFVFLGLYVLNHNIVTAFPPDLIRGLSGVGIGCLLAQIFLLYKNYKNTHSGFTVNTTAKIFITFLEIALFGYMIYCLFTTKSHVGHTDIVFLFSILLMLFVSKIGYFSRFLDSNFSKFLGQYSYSIYMTHAILLHLYKKYWFIPGNVGNIWVSGGGG